MDYYPYVSEAVSPTVTKSLLLILTFTSDTSTNEQKQDWFLALNPNGKATFLSEIYTNQL